MSANNTGKSHPPGQQKVLGRPATPPEVNLQNVEDFSRVCRICATITEFIIPIYSGEGMENNLADKINRHLPIRISTRDTLPKVVCYQCASTVMAWHELVKCCEQADQALKAKVCADKSAKEKLKADHANQPSTSAVEDDVRLKFRDIFDYSVLDSVTPRDSPAPRGSPPSRKYQEPPKYSPRRRCKYCYFTTHSEDEYGNHMVSEHSQLFFCAECQQYIGRREFLSHMSHHADNYTKPNSLKTESKTKQETDINQNTADTQKSDQSTQLQTPKSPQNTRENEFSDHSDAENGFDPLPESVFEAIEDSQSSQICEEDNQTNQTIDEEAPQTLETNTEEHNSKEPNSKKSKSPKKRTCPICSKVYTASSSFFYHMKHTHKRVKEHECEFCMKKFATRATLTSHLTTHSNECQFECKQCKKRYRSKASLYIHEQTHNGIKTWSCTQCNISFRWKAHLARHMKRHLGDKSHMCATCGRGFSVHCDLLRHMRTHDTGKFECKLCDIKYSQIRYLKVHMAKKHASK